MLESLHAVIVDRIDVGIFAVDADQRVVLWNQFMALHSGLAADQVVGRDLYECFPELPEGWLRKKIDSVFILKNRAFTSWQHRPYLFRFRHNRPVTGGVDAMQQSCTLLPIKDSAGDVRCVCIALFDATDTAIYQRMMQDALDSMEEMSVRDGLTGLYNRRYLETTLEAEFARARRHDKRLSVLMFDVDHFKEVNDTHGHRAGDDVLRAVAGRMTQMQRSSDTAGRYGGEEFTLVLPETGSEGAMAAAERLRREIADTPVGWRDAQVRVTVSVGVTSLRPDIVNHERLLDEADRALYEAKRGGRDQVRRFEPA